MKKLMLAASAAAFVFAAPAYAGPGKGNSKQSHPMGHKMGKSHKQGGLFDANDHAKGFGVGGCPPGLVNRTPSCVPPGHAKRRFGIGQRVPFGYNGLLGYNALPYDLRSRYGAALDPRSRYIHDNSYLYRIDPQTMLVQQVLGALIR